MDYKRLAGQSFSDIQDEIEDDENIIFEKNNDIRIKNDIDKRKNFKQEKNRS